MAAEEGNIIRGIFTGEEQPEEWEDEDSFEVWPIILRNVTHLSVHDSVNVVRRNAFQYHPNIVELICHDAFIKIEEYAFWNCPRLKRLVLPGVEEVEEFAFSGCEAIAHVECGKLEIIREDAFTYCYSLGSIDLPSARIVDARAFANCKALRDAKFGKHLDYLGGEIFHGCTALERITIPFKNGLIAHIDMFTDCDKLKRVDLVEDDIIHEVVDALVMKEWRQDMRNEIDSINQILPNTPADTVFNNVGRKTDVIREWMQRVLNKITSYTAQHRSLLNEAAAILQLDLPSDIVQNNVLAFLELPFHTFDEEEEDWFDY